ncbi:hypothetical protein [Myxococcus sp. RHSTA-1-4]|uniref:hypothetical protein n=1 Tax=Myxococcus sp. RHSTA-1-4 TaxID=2874601 RepID=UPI001CC10547|nr:hypothetical protein [Myxococcus sp. RHSTA-1-4]MBZ4418780.1 hypothetical protein [Myxococcus sp. RHSTA-1-4]
MEILGSAIVGVIIFSILILAVVLGGALGNKQERDLRELTSQQRAAGMTGDVSMHDRDLDYDDRHVPV